MANPEAPSTVHNNSNSITDRLGLLGLVVAIASITLQITGVLNKNAEILSLQQDNARLRTLNLNHTDKLDDDTRVAQQLLAAATTMLSSCKK